MNKFIIIPVLFLASCSKTPPSLHDIVLNTVDMQIVPHFTHPEPSLVGNYQFSYPEVTNEGHALSCKVTSKFYVDGDCLEDETTSSSRGPSTSSVPIKKRIHNLDNAAGSTRLALSALGPPGSYAEVTFELIIIITDEVTDSVLVNEVKSISQKMHRPETQPKAGENASRPTP